MEMYPPRPKIEVFQEKCGNAAECMRCLTACPYRLIGMLQEKPPEAGSDGPEKFNIIVAFKVLCTVCGKCEEACDKGAIRVSY